ncbi:MAG: peptidoglycan-binding domain-containing protein [Sarcina sp.]
MSRRLGDILKSKGIAVEYSRTSNSITIGFSVGSEDRIYGYSTEEQVIKFQKKKGLSVEGKVGLATRDASMNTSSGGGLPTLIEATNIYISLS